MGALKDEAGGPDVGDTTDVACTALWREQLKLILKIGFPVGLSTVLRTAGQTVDLAWVGHIGKDELAAATYCSLMMSSVAGLIMATSFATVTLSSQARGARNLPLMGSWFTIGTCMAVCQGIILTVILGLITKTFINAIDNNSRVAGLTAGFGWLIYWWMPMNAFVLMLRIVLQSWHDVYPPLIIAFISVGLSVGLNDLFIHGAAGAPGFLGSGLGFHGSAVATLVSLTFQGLLLSGYVLWWSKKDPQTSIMPGVGLHAFSMEGVRVVWQQGMERVFVVSIQKWTLSIPPLFLAGINSETVAAGGVLANLSQIIFALFWGWGAAVQVLGAQHVGRGDQPRFCTCIMVALGVASVGTAIVCSTLYILRHDVVSVFTTDPEVKARALAAFPYLCLTMFVMGIGQIFDGSLDACCLNKWRNYGSGISLLLLGVPLSIYLALGTSLELKGLWLGLLAGCVLRVVIFAILYTQIDLPGCIQCARERQSLLVKSAMSSLLSSGDLESSSDDPDGSPGPDEVQGINDIATTFRAAIDDTFRGGIDDTFISCSHSFAYSSEE